MCWDVVILKDLLYYIAQGVWGKILWGEARKPPPTAAFTKVNF